MVRPISVFVVGVVVALAGRDAAAQRWQDATADCMGATAEWSNKIEVADVDGDGQPDILIANGGNYSSAGTPQPARVFKNLGNWAAAGSHCTDISATAVGGFTGLSRMIKAADIDGDGDLDILTGGAYGTQLHLYKRDGGTWVDATAQLPQQATSIGDAELGDVDGDGDLDIVLADWGPTVQTGGRTRLYLNDGHGTFTEATATNMPDQIVKWSWDLELVDVDNDFDLDVLVSCKLCTTSYLFKNDGAGHFTADATALPHFSNNYEFEAMDVDGDGDLDLATINDGPNSTNHLFINDGTGKFTDETSTRLFGAANPPADDNAVVWLDVDDDGDADMLVASLGPDRVLLNDGTGHFTLSAATTPNDTDASLGIAVADLNGDGRLDVVQAQGESAFGDKVQLATSMVAADTRPPVIAATQVIGTRVVARVHDHASPSHLHDWQRVWVVYNGTDEVDMHWYGEYLWSATLPQAPTQFQVCAKDRAGNQACSGAATPDGPVFGAEVTITPPGGGGGGGCCDAGGSPAGAVLPLALVALGRRRRRLAR